MLTLPIKRRWLDAILEKDTKKRKDEEYRADSRYYDARIGRWQLMPVTIRLRAGYRMDSPAALAVVIPVKRMAPARPEWGLDAEFFGWVLTILDVKRER